MLCVSLPFPTRVGVDYANGFKDCVDVQSKQVSAGLVLTPEPAGGQVNDWWG